MLKNLRYFLSVSCFQDASFHFDRVTLLTGEVLLVQLWNLSLLEIKCIFLLHLALSFHSRFIFA